MQGLGWALLCGFLLIASSFFMVTAWYVHLKYHHWSMIKSIAISWAIAFFEFSLLVPANKIGSEKAGITAAQLRGISEIAILLSFIVFQSTVLKQPLLWNHVVGFIIVIIGVMIVLLGPFKHQVIDGQEPPKFQKLELSGLGVSTKSVAPQLSP